MCSFINPMLSFILAAIPFIPIFEDNAATENIFELGLENDWSSIINLK